ncbi:MAG: hypothetical protein ACJAR2_004180, partial [Ilumatobacter sp.]
MAAPASAQDDTEPAEGATESIGGTLQGRDDTGSRFPVEGVTIIVRDA